jgi:uncharacterized protein
MKNQTTVQKIVHFPLTKMTIGIIVCVGLYGISQFGFGKLLATTTLENDVKNLIVGIFSSLIAIFSYVYLFKIYEKRDITELSTKGIGGHLVKGILLGFVLQALTILVIYVKGGYSVISINPFLYLIPSLTMAFTSAIFEEILMRGIIFRLIEEKLGSYIALIISAILFGAMHLSNPNSSLIAAIGLAIQAGLLLAAAFIYTKNLWFPIAIHFAWNFTQSGIFGANTSGNALNKTLIASKIEGAEWFTGGAFGPEGSIQATIFCLMATIGLLILCQKERKMIKPFWAKEVG